MFTEENGRIDSPFKFLYSYEKEDLNFFFGRDRETRDLLKLFRNASLLVLHGPSGCGKTSLINCGLMNNVGIHESVIFNIRRKDNLINSIKESLFYARNDQKHDGIHFRPQFEEYLSNQKLFRSVQIEYDETDHTINEAEDKLLSIQRRMRRINAQKEQDPDLITQLSKELEELNEIIKNNQVTKNNLRIEKERIRSESTKIIQESLNFFKGLYKRYRSIPLMIFDQFEELFLRGSEEEIDQFGLFLKLLIENSYPVNVILSLREEWFGHLDVLQHHIPNLFYKKLRLTNPDIDTIRLIIDQSFEQFNINQYKDHGNLENRVELSDDEKAARTNLIIDQLKINRDSRSRYHLPYLQLYLDRIYKKDFERTYKKSNDDTIKILQNHYGHHLPLEITPSEIESFGNITKVLEEYITDISKEKTLIDLLGKENSKNVLIKILRQFSSTATNKRYVPVQRQNSSIVIKDLSLEKDIHRLFGAKVDKSLAFTTIINHLIDARILKESQKIIELSHDTLSHVINRIRIEDDLIELYRENFITAFNLYQKTKDQKDLLGGNQIGKYAEYEDFVVADGDEKIEKEKRNYIVESNKKATRETRRKFQFLSGIIVAITLLLAATVYAVFQINYQLVESKIDKASFLKREMRYEEALNSLDIIDVKLYTAHRKAKLDTIKLLTAQWNQINELVSRSTQLLNNSDSVPFPKSAQFYQGVVLMDSAFQISPDAILASASEQLKDSLDLLCIERIISTERFIATEQYEIASDQVEHAMSFCRNNDQNLNRAIELRDSITLLVSQNQ